MISRVIRRACGLGIVVGAIAIVCAPVAVSSAARLAPRPNLVVHLSATPRPAQVGQNLTYTATVRNYHADASNVTLQGLDPAAVDVRLRDRVAGLLHRLAARRLLARHDRARRVGQGDDRRQADRERHDREQRRRPLRPARPAAVVEPRPDRRGGRPAVEPRVGGSAAPRPGHVGSDLTYTLHVRNLGGTDATNVKVTARIPARSTFVSATASQGSCTGTAPIVCSLGGLAKGATATVTLVAKPTAAGRLVASAHVQADQRDPRPWNNTVRLLTRVLPS